MIEVFKTTVDDAMQAQMLVDKIHENFSGYRANFDLEDCDRILRVKSRQGAVQCAHVVELLKDFGFDAVVLEDVTVN